MIAAVSNRPPKRRMPVKIGALVVASVFLCGCNAGSDAAPDTARRHYPDLDIQPALRTLAFETQPRNALAKKTRFVRWLTAE